MSAEINQYKLHAGRHTPRVALVGELSVSGVFADDDAPRRRNMVHETINRTVKPKTSSFWKIDLSILLRGSRL